MKKNFKLASLLLIFFCSLQARASVNLPSFAQPDYHTSDLGAPPSLDPRVNSHPKRHKPGNLNQLNRVLLANKSGRFNKLINTSPQEFTEPSKWSISGERGRVHQTR